MTFDWHELVHGVCDINLFISLSQADECDELIHCCCFFMETQLFQSNG